MADRIRFACSATPIETLTDENSGSHDILASEVKKSLYGSGESVSFDNYSGSGEQQGQTNAAPYYRSAAVTAGGTSLSTRTLGDFIFIKNTGYNYSSATALGTSSTDYVIVAAKIPAHATGTSTGGYVSGAGADRIQYIELATLKPGQAVVLPGACASFNVTQFGSNAGDLNKLNQFDAEGEDGGAQIYVKTVLAADGGLAATANAVEFLAVT